MATITGSSGNDTLNGTPDADALNGADGNDSVDGGAGDDLIWGGLGGDTLLGGDGLDTIAGEDGNDSIDGGAGGDAIDGGAGLDTIYGGTGDDIVWGGDDADTIYGEDGLDSLNGEAGNDYIDGGADDDVIWGGTGDDTILGGTGNDIIAGEDGNDSILGEDGDDAINGGAGADTISGGVGNDLIWGGDDGDVISGDDGNDVIAGEAGADSIDGGAGTDFISGGTGDDTLSGGFGSDTFAFYGGDGVDLVQGGEDIDGSDIDVLDFSAADQGFTVTFTGDEAGTYVDDSTDASGSFVEIERIIGTTYSDTIDASADSAGIQLEGGGGSDSLTGGSGADLISGGTGGDVLTGGLGDDTLTGGSGADTIVMLDASGADTVTDFDMTLVGGFTTDQLDVSDLTDAQGDPVNIWDVQVTDVGGSALLTFPGGTSILLSGVDISEVSTGPQLISIGIPCFVAGTLIDTPQGPRAVETIRAGDLVTTAEGAPIAVLWAGGKSFGPRALAADARLKPVVLKPGSFGNARPLRLSRQHRVALDTPEGARLVAAGHLPELPHSGARVAEGCRHVSYHHLLLARHALIVAEGAVVESLWPGPIAAAALGPETCAEIARACPDLAPALYGRVPVEAVFGPQALPGLTRRDLRALTRHLAQAPGRSRWIA